MNRLLQILFGTKAERKPARQKKTQLGVETLEDRCLMTTASLVHIGVLGHQFGVLAVQGSARNDAITVAHVGSRISVSGVQGSFKASDVQKLVVNGGFGNDTIRVNLLPADHIGVAVHGGFGDDTIFGSVLSDRLFGDAGSDHIYGRSGDDSIDGGSGRDYLYGGFNNVIAPPDGDDFLQADFDDHVVHGEKGTDTITYAHQDPSRLSIIHGDETALANFINNSGLLDNLPLSWTKNHVKYRVSHLQLVHASISNHVSRLVLRGELHTETTANVNGHPLASAKGTIRFSVQPVLNMVLGEGDLVNSASVTLGNTAVEAINIHNINNAVDNPGQFRVWLNDALGTQHYDIADQVQLYVNSGFWPDHHA